MDNVPYFMANVCTFMDNQVLNIPCFMDNVTTFVDNFPRVMANVGTFMDNDFHFDRRAGPALAGARFGSGFGRGRSGLVGADRGRSGL